MTNAGAAQLEIRTASLGEVVPIRSRVLRPGQPPEATVSANDSLPDVFHLAALDAQGGLLGVASFSPDASPEVSALPELQGVPAAALWRLRGMAVLPERQGRGIGRLLLADGLARIAERGGRVLWCNARVDAARYYAHVGMQRCGAEFDIPSIGPHWLMWTHVAQP